MNSHDDFQHEVDRWKEAAADLGRRFDSANRRIAELERKLAEQQSKIMRHEMQNGTSAYIEGFEELNTLLAQAREEGRKEDVPDGWQVVPVVPTAEMIDAGYAQGNDDARSIFKFSYIAMLAAAPTSEVK